MELSLVEFVLFVLFGSFGLMLVSAVVSRTLFARAEKRALGRRVVCRLCLHTFESRDAAKIIECPECGVANERGGRKRWS